MYFPSCSKNTYSYKKSSIFFQYKSLGNMNYSLTNNSTKEYKPNSFHFTDSYITHTKNNKLTNTEIYYKNNYHKYYEENRTWPGLFSNSLSITAF